MSRRVPADYHAASHADDEEAGISSGSTTLEISHPLELTETIDGGEPVPADDDEPKGRKETIYIVRKVDVVWISFSN